jgi:hypothetical protein
VKEGAREWDKKRIYRWRRERGWVKQGELVEEGTLG